MDGEDLPSDTSDEDYVPTDGEKPSEEDESGDDENLEGLGNEEGEVVGERRKKVKKKTKKRGDPGPRQRTGGIRLEDEEGDGEKQTEDEYSKKLAESIKQEEEAKKENEQKKKADDLWSSFMSDVGRPKPKPKAAPSAGLGSLSSIVKPASGPAVKTVGRTGSSPAAVKINTDTSQLTKVTITKEYDFAGETVKITKEVSADSKEAKEQLKKEQEKPDVPKQTVGASLGISGIKRPGGGGLGSVLNKIGKKPKIGTLEKSKLDWDAFKVDEGISEELEIHNRGKEGYIERKKFLEKADVRQFEIERDLRLSRSGKR